MILGSYMDGMEDFSVITPSKNQGGNAQSSSTLGEVSLHDRSWNLNSTDNIHRRTAHNY